MSSPLVKILPHRQANFDMYVRSGVYGDWDLGIRNEVADAYYWDALRLEPITHVLDIGAHIGFYTANALVYWPSAQYVAVEPERENFGLLALNMARFGQVQVLHGAVVDDPVNEVGRLYKANTNSGGHVVKVFKRGEESEEITTEVYTPQGYPLPLYDLTRVLEYAHNASPLKHDSKVLLKLDCEGAEWSIIEAPSMCGIDYVVGEYHYPLSQFAEHLEYYLKPRFKTFDYLPLGTAQGLFLARRN